MHFIEIYSSNIYWIPTGTRYSPCFQGIHSSLVKTDKWWCERQTNQWRARVQRNFRALHSLNIIIYSSVSMITIDRNKKETRTLCVSAKPPSPTPLSPSQPYLHYPSDLGASRIISQWSEAHHFFFIPTDASSQLVMWAVTTPICLLSLFFSIALTILWPLFILIYLFLPIRM